MEPENKDVPEVLETPAVATETTPETPQPELTVEQIAELQAKAAKADDLESKNKQLFERLKKQPTPEPSQNEPQLSTKDIAFLAQNPVHEDDMDEVLDRMKSKNISFSKAYEQVKPILEKNTEERKTASAANVRNARSSPSKVSDDVLLSNASQGKLPENDEDIARLVAAKAKG
jgi:hypothetical protein